MAATYSVVVKRAPWYESKNAYVRWDDYGGGDSAWHGGEIVVWRKNDPPVNDPVWEVPHPVKNAVLKWCEHWLPTDKGRLRESPGWQIEFQVVELKWGDGHQSAQITPMIMDAVREIMLQEASRALHATL